MKKKLVLAVILCLIIFPKVVYSQNTWEECSPWDCKCDKTVDRCIRTGFGKYQCQPATKIGYDCQPQAFGLGCIECGSGLECKRAGFGTYICIPKDADPEDYLCNPWTHEPCEESEGEKCVRISWGHYECSKSATAKKLCNGMPPECDQCIEAGKAWTALGCLPTDPLELVKHFFPFLLGLGGLAAFSLIVVSGIRILTSGGNPEKIQGAKETITSAVTGLLFIILSLFLLKLIGGDILGLPAFLGN